MLIRSNTIKSLENYETKEYANITFQELPFITKINLRGDPHNKDFMLTVGKIFDIVIPTKPNTYTNNGTVKIIWLSLNEWLIVNEKNNLEESLILNLKKMIENNAGSTTNVSENRTVLRISGSKVFKLLSKFLTLNLNESLNNQSSCSQTLFVKVPILIVRNNENDQDPIIDIFTNRSHSNYIYNLLIDGTKNLDF